MNDANFLKTVGIEMIDFDKGSCRTCLEIKKKHLQQDGIVHAGVLATMADHTAGAAGCTLVSDDEIVLSVEFKINFLRPAIGEMLECKAKVLKPGRTIIVAESEIEALSGGKRKLVSKATVTLAVTKPLMDRV